MPRIARIVITGYPHHITQRGNYKQTVFVSSADYRFYLEHMDEYCRKYKLLILSYCLMPNHVHFIAIPEEKYSLAKTLNACHMRYAQYFNKKSDLIGHLWQGRFCSCALDDNHLNAAIRYVENNPVRAGLVKQAWLWNWSSAKTHLKKVYSPLSLVDINKYIQVGNWKSYLLQKESKENVSEIKRNTLTGRPFGDDVFIKKLENLFSKRLRALPKGRPKKK